MMLIIVHSVWIEDMNICDNLVSQVFLKVALYFTNMAWSLRFQVVSEHVMLFKMLNTTITLSLFVFGQNKYK